MRRLIARAAQAAGSSRLAAACAVLGLALAATPASAQTPPTAEGAVGYQFLYDEDSDTRFPIGWIASVGGHATRWLVLVGEVSGSYRALSIGPTQLLLRTHAFAAGPRVFIAQGAGVSPFVQALVGVSHGSIEAAGSALAASSTRFIVQPGAGFDVNAWRTGALRFEADLRGVRDQGRTQRQLRLAAAVVFRN